MTSTLNRYIARRILYGLCLTFVIVTGIIMLVDFVEGTRKYSADGTISSFQIFILTMFKAPKLIEQTIPFVVLFGVMGTLFDLNRRSELIVLRASGLSAWRFLTPALFVTAMLGVLWAVIFNPLASRAINLHSDYVAKYTGSQAYFSKDDIIWMREGSETGQTVIRAQDIDISTQTLQNVKFWVFKTDTSGKTQFSHRLDAASAIWTTGYWKLSNVIENSSDGVSSDIAFLSLPTTLAAQDLDKAITTKSLPAFWQLPREIKRMQLAGFSTTRLNMQFHRLLSLPVMLIAMTFIAAGASMHLSREGGTLRLMIFGATLGFAVFFIDSIIGAFGEIGVLPPALAVWIIPFFVLFCGMAYLAKIEDG